MKINEIKKKDGSTVYRANIYLGVDVITGKKVTTKVTARTKKELKTKAQQAQFDFNWSDGKYNTRVGDTADMGLI